MTTKKIEEKPSPATCRDPDHAPASHRVYAAGLHEHTCPSCGHREMFRITDVML